MGEICFLVVNWLDWDFVWCIVNFVLIFFLFFNVFLLGIDIIKE